jgi:DMSO/TMAO reductase YedYZ molybdopterin-dependent catalytic subunit
VTTTAESEPDQKPRVHVAVGRRVFLGMVALGLAGIVFGGQVESALDSELQRLFPWWPGFRIYSISGSYPQISESEYRLEISGLVDKPQVFTLEDLKAMPSTSFSQEFQCVTGWTVPNVQWEASCPRVLCLELWAIAGRVLPRRLWKGPGLRQAPAMPPLARCTPRLPS